MAKQKKPPVECKATGGRVGKDSTFQKTAFASQGMPYVPHEAGGTTFENAALPTAGLSLDQSQDPYGMDSGSSDGVGTGAPAGAPAGSIGTTESAQSVGQEGVSSTAGPSMGTIGLAGLSAMGPIGALASLGLGFATDTPSLAGYAMDTMNGQNTSIGFGQDAMNSAMSAMDAQAAENNGDTSGGTSGASGSTGDGVGADGSGGNDSGNAGDGAGSSGDSGGGDSGGDGGGWADGGIIGYANGGQVGMAPQMPMNFMNAVGYADGGMMGTQPGLAPQSAAPQGDLNSQPPMDPQLLNSKLDEVLTKSPEAEQQVRQAIEQAMASGELTLPELKQLTELAKAASQNPQIWPQLRTFVIRQGIAPPEDIPEQYDQSLVIVIMLLAKISDKMGTDPQAGAVIPPQGMGAGPQQVGPGTLKGPGTGTSDSIKAVNMATGGEVKVSTGEYIIPKSVVDAKGKDFFDGLIRKYHTPVGYQG